MHLFVASGSSSGAHILERSAQRSSKDKAVEKVEVPMDISMTEEEDDDNFEQFTRHNSMDVFCNSSVPPVQLPLSLSAHPRDKPGPTGPPKMDCGDKRTMDADQGDSATMPANREDCPTSVADVLTEVSNFSLDVITLHAVSGTSMF